MKIRISIYITPHLSGVNLICLFIIQPLNTPRPFCSSSHLSFLTGDHQHTNTPFVQCTRSSRTTQVCSQLPCTVRADSHFLLLTVTFCHCKHLCSYSPVFLNTLWDDPFKGSNNCISISFPLQKSHWFFPILLFPCNQLPLGFISFTQLVCYWHEALGSVLSSNSPELLQEPFFIPQLSPPAPLLDASCCGFLALTPANKQRMVNARALELQESHPCPSLPTELCLLGCSPESYSCRI